MTRFENEAGEVYIGQDPTVTGTFIGKIEATDRIIEGVFHHNAEAPLGVLLHGYGRVFRMDY